MRVLRVLAVSLLFVFTGIGIVGGCGGGGGGGGNGGGGPEPACRVPPLNSNFVNEVYVFIDEPNNVIVGVTSDGETVAIAAADIVDNPIVLNFGAIPVDENLAIIDFLVYEGVVLGATGEGVRVDDGGIFQVNDLVYLGAPLAFDIEGECLTVEQSNISSAETIRSIASDFSQGVDGVGIIEDFANRVLNNGE